MKQRTGGVSMDIAAGVQSTAHAERQRTEESREAPATEALTVSLSEAHSQYSARLEAVAYRILRNRTDAEDVVQKIFIALRSVQFEGRSSLWTYLYRAAVNGSVNVLRSKKRREVAEQRLLDVQRVSHRVLADSHDPESKVLEGEILSEVAKALLQVKPQHRRVLVLRIMHGLSNTEIAEREDLPLATVGTWLRRGRKELRKGMRPLLRELGRDE
jgi:RNA polymerase sigma-70 factor (ECF subfamily)